MGMRQAVLKRERKREIIRLFPARLAFHSPKEKQIALMSNFLVGLSTDSHPAVFPTYLLTALR